MIKPLRLAALCTIKKDSLVDYGQRGQLRSPLNLNVNDNVHNFIVTNRQQFPDFDIDYVKFVSSKYGCSWHHFDCEQETNSIALIIKYPQTPENNVPELIKLCIEKLIQAGSRQYPIRNPLLQMTKRSFNAQDHTHSTSDYLFVGYQTPLIADHKNLLQVHLHTVFNPLLRQQDFAQIIWRYQSGGDNEMQLRGQLTDELSKLSMQMDNRIFNALQNKLLGKNSVAKKDIVQLRYENVVKWCNSILIPENLIVATHGDMHPVKLIANFEAVLDKLRGSRAWPSSNLQGKGNKHAVKHQLESSRTIYIDQSERNVLFLLSFQINPEHVSEEEKILLPILSFLLFDMPESPFMVYNSPQNSYPKLYGYQGDYFNVGVTVSLKGQSKKMTDNQEVEQQRELRDKMQEIYRNKLSNRLIEQCLLHLEGEYYSTDGFKIINGCLGAMLDVSDDQNESKRIQLVMNVKSTISRILRTFRQTNLFEELLNKFLISNSRFVRVVGRYNPYLIQDTQFQQTYQLGKLYQSFTEEQKESVRNYKSPTVLQDVSSLPKIDVNQLQIFEEKSPNIFELQGIRFFHRDKCNGVKVVLKIDLTDLQEDELKFLPIICQTYPWMGYKGVQGQDYKAYVAMYIRDIRMRYEAVRATEGIGMKIYGFLQIQFTERNSDFGFNLLQNLIRNHDAQNIQVLSERVKRKASQIYNEISQNMIQVHGRHIAGTVSPYALIEDPLFAARSLCSLASDIIKVSNSKDRLIGIAYQISKITKRFYDRRRISVLVQCRSSNLKKYERNFTRLGKLFKNSQSTDLESQLSPIEESLFEPQSCLKYFPNYNQELVFEAFPMPYYSELQRSKVPAAIVLSSLVNLNIRRYNPLGGSFLFKGAMVSYLRGSRNKLIELESYYRKIQTEDISSAKLAVFQQYRRYTAADCFYSGVEPQQARTLKQAVAMASQENIEDCLNQYIIQRVKANQSSILALGRHLGNYENLIKKGWSVQRAIDEMSMSMQGKTTEPLQLEMSKYINIY